MKRLIFTALVMSLASMLPAQTGPAPTTLTYTISLDDTEALPCEQDEEPPVLFTAGASQGVGCDWSFDPSVFPVYDASGEVTVEVTITPQYVNAWMAHDCTTAFYEPQQFSMALLSGLPDWGMLTLEDGVFLEEGTNATLTGVLRNTASLDDYFEVELYWTDRLDWEGWSNQDFFTSWKHDFGLVTDEYLDWEYFLLSTDSKLIGHGAYAGSVLNLTHAPSAMAYGHQLGVLANNASEGYGLGGWFEWWGECYIDGELYSDEGHGDVMLDLTPCIRTDYLLEFTLTDACGNSAQYTHTLHESSQGIWDGTCTCHLPGCTNPEALNYDPDALASDGSCVGCLGDFDLDGVIQNDDLLTLVANFECALPTSCPTDLNGDGVTGIPDVLVLLGLIGQGCD